MHSSTQKNAARARGTYALGTFASPSKANAAPPTAPPYSGAGAFRARYPSVGATLNAVVAAALADGETIVANAAITST